ncbi:MAG: DNA polymerase III subunit delta [Defluviitaleaceae bacterium]|nr:DNA polymerase III subunit delta [Defluviitaleaceae bacterium]
MKDLKEDLKNKNFASMYVFSGEPYLKRHYELQFRKAIGEDLVDILEEPTAAKVLELANALSFFGSNRLIIVRNSGFFGKKSEETLLNLNPSNIVIFIEESIDKRTKFFKHVKSNGKIYEFETLTESDLIKWLTSLAKKRKKEVPSNVARYFLQTVGTNMYTLENEFEKLLSYTGEIFITEQDIDEVCTKSVEAKIFAMLKAVGEKKPVIVLKEYEALIISKEEPLKILSMAARQIRLILRAKALSSSGFSNDIIAKKMGILPFVVRECLMQAKNFKYNSLINALNECATLDANLKIGKVPMELGVEIFLTKFAMGKF